jgi:hypothetical protein
MAWGAGPPLAMVAPSRAGARGAAGDAVGAPPAAAAGAPPGVPAGAPSPHTKALVDCSAPLTYPATHCAPAVLCSRPPADPDAAAPYATRTKCWQCGKAVGVCTAWQKCNTRDGLAVHPLNGAKSYREAYVVTARALGALPPSAGQRGAKRGRA